MKQMISTEPSLQQRIQLLREATYDGPVQARNPRQKVSDEELVTLFGTIKGKWVRVDDLNEAFQNLVSVNVSNPKRPPVNYGILRRLKVLTGQKWRQKTATDPKGTKLAKFYVPR